LFALIVIRGSLKLLRYALTIISAAALLAEYGFVGANMLVSLRSAAPTGTSPYTSSVEMCMNLFTPCSRALSSSTCVPYTFVLVNSYELPKLRSTCDCAAKWKMVSILCLRSTRLTSAGDVMSPFSKAKFALSSRMRVLLSVAQ
jgi:hypothetical protein